MDTSAMAAALSIISFVIFVAPCVCACAHNTPGNNVPAKPIPEQVFMKFRRSSIFILHTCHSCARVPYHITRLPTASWKKRTALPAGLSLWPLRSLLSVWNPVSCLYLERSCDETLRKAFRILPSLALRLRFPSDARCQSQQLICRTRHHPHGPRHHSQTFSRTRLFPRSSRRGATSQHWRRAFCR